MTPIEFLREWELQPKRNIKWQPTQGKTTYISRYKPYGAKIDLQVDAL